MNIEFQTSRSYRHENLKNQTILKIIFWSRNLVMILQIVSTPFEVKVEDFQRHAHKTRFRPENYFYLWKEKKTEQIISFYSFFSSHFTNKKIVNDRAIKFLLQFQLEIIFSFWVCLFFPTFWLYSATFQVFKKDLEKKS